MPRGHGSVHTIVGGFNIDPRRRTGDRGEQIAADYLSAAGLRVLERNFRRREGEIDIIARDGDTLVFVEVKSSRSLSFSDPETWVDARKQRRIGRAAAAYLQRRGWGEVSCRFDVVAVDLTAATPRVRHIVDAFWL